MTTPPVNARFAIQCDWNDALWEENGKAWVSWKPSHETKSHHGEISNCGFATDGLPHLRVSDKFACSNITKKSITVGFESDDHVATFLAPVTSYSQIHNKSVRSLDVSNGGLAVSACTENKLLIWETSTGEIRRELTGHLGDVTVCRFFPSGVVVLSGGSDMQLKIWSAETGQCPVTLVGHTRGISDTAIVDRGRNVISVSRDGTARLWDCGQATLLDTIASCDTIINSCAISSSDVSVNFGVPDEQPSEREVGTEGKLLLLAGENGCVLGYGVHSRKKVFQMQCSDAVNTCTFLSAHEFVCGTQDGHLYIYDIRKNSSPVAHWAELRSAILCVRKYQQGFFTSTQDGSCFYTNYKNLEKKHTLELTGSDCDPIYSVCSNGRFIYTACRDKFIRKYKLSREHIS